MDWTAPKIVMAVFIVLLLIALWDVLGRADRLRWEGLLECGCDVPDENDLDLPSVYTCPEHKIRYQLYILGRKKGTHGDFIEVWHRK